MCLKQELKPSRGWKPGVEADNNPSPRETEEFPQYCLWSCGMMECSNADDQVK